MAKSSLFRSVRYEQGFVNARTWLADVREHADPHLTCILVGNKTDLCDDSAPPNPFSSSRDRQVPKEEGEQWAKEEGLLFVEASAKSGVNVDLAFLEASRNILDKVQRGVFDEGTVRLATTSLTCVCESYLTWLITAISQPNIINNITSNQITCWYKLNEADAYIIFWWNLVYKAPSCVLSLFINIESSA